MGKEVNVQRVEALRAFNLRINNFSVTLGSRIASIHTEVTQIIEWIGQCERQWRRKVAECEAHLAEAERRYTQCIEAARRDETSSHSCAGLGAEVNRARAALAEARREWREAIKWRSRIEQSVRNYVASARKAQNLVNETLSQASFFLRRKMSELDRFLAESMPVPSEIRVFGRPHSHRSSYRTAKQKMLVSCLDDPFCPKDIKGWIRNEQRRVQRNREAYREGRPVRHRNSSMRMPNGLDAGHRIPEIDTPANLRFEPSSINRTRYHRARRLGLDDRFR